jgi:hypothetical protein
VKALVAATYRAIAFRIRFASSPTVGDSQCLHAQGAILVEPVRPSEREIGGMIGWVCGRLFGHAASLSHREWPRNCPEAQRRERRGGTG